MPTERKASALNVMAQRYNVEPDKLLATLKGTVFKNATNEELLALVVVANEYGLNPFLKQIYAFPSKRGGIDPIVSIDGWIKIVNDQPTLDGVEFEFTESNGKPVSCTAIIWVKNRRLPVRVPEYFEECFRPTEPWKMMPRRMLRHKALMQCARVAFGLGGILDEDEAQDIAKRIPNATTPSYEIPVDTQANDQKQIAAAQPTATVEKVVLREPEDNVPMDSPSPFAQQTVETKTPEPVAAPSATPATEPKKREPKAPKADAAPKEVPKVSNVETLKSLIVTESFKEAAVIELCTRKYKGAQVNSIDEYTEDYAQQAVENWGVLIAPQLRMDRAIG